jgi:apolipoprotein N-acyltransferase
MDGNVMTAARIRGALERLLLIVIGCVFETLATPPGPAPALVFVQDAPFLLLLWHRGGERWKRWAFVYGFVRFAVGMRWLAQVHWSMGFAAAFILAFTQLAWGGAIRALVRRRVPYLPVVAVTAVLQEMSQTVVMGSSGMPWPARPLAFVAWPAFIGAASMFGAYGLSALAAVGSAWASGLPGLVHRDGWRFERIRGLIATSLALGALVAVVAWNGMLHTDEVSVRLDGLRPIATKTAPLVVIQGSIEQHLKNEHSDHDVGNEILDRHLRLTSEALARLLDEHTDALAVLWPETMIPWPFLSRDLAQRFPDAPTGGSWQDEHAVLSAIRDAVPPGATTRFLLGVNHFFEGRSGKHDDPRDCDEHDSVIFVDVAQVPQKPPDPANWPATGLWPWEFAPGRHDKVVLVPWGEYAPGGSFIPGVRWIRDRVSIIPEITPGDPDQEPFLLALAPGETPDAPRRKVLAGTVVCFEIAFPARCRSWRDRGATVLLNAGNYAWYGDTDMPAQVQALARLRAAELAVTVVVAGNTGPSCIIDPAGAVRTLFVRGGRTQFVEGWCAGPLWSDPSYRTLYSRWGDIPWFVMGGLLLLAGLLRGRQGRSAMPKTASTVTDDEPPPVQTSKSVSDPNNDDSGTTRPPTPT